MKILPIILLFYNCFSVLKNENLFMDSIKTPDGNSFRIKVITRQEADKLEKEYKHNIIDSEMLSVSHKSAYLIEGGYVLYRQFNNDIGFIFPTIKDYKIGTSGNNYWNTSIQINDKNEIVVAFWLKPALANNFRKKIKKELNQYESFEGREFYLLDDNSVIMLRCRTPILSDGYWYNSISNFDFFYYIISGKGKE